MPQDNRSIDSPVQPCACVTHDFDITLCGAPDVSPRPTWWPVDNGGAYSGESMSIALGGVDVRQTLSGGSFGATGIPPGVAKVQFDKFYDDVRTDIEQRTNLPDA
jgi:hypothetical protein